jgi:hypothetical protein
VPGFELKRSFFLSIRFVSGANVSGGRETFQDHECTPVQQSAFRERRFSLTDRRGMIQKGSRFGKRGSKNGHRKTAARSPRANSRRCGSARFRVGKCFIQGTYSAILAAEFPSVYQITVYAAITSGHGKTELELRVVSTEDLHSDESQEPLKSQKLSVDFPDPLVVLEAVFSVPVVFPSPGEYRIQLFGNGQPLRERRLQVIPAPTA